MPIHGDKIFGLWTTATTVATGATSSSSGVRTEEFASGILTVLTTAVTGTATVNLQSAHEDVAASYVTTYTTSVTATGNKAILGAQLGKYTRVSVTVSGGGSDTWTGTVQLDAKT